MDIIFFKFTTNRPPRLFFSIGWMQKWSIKDIHFFFVMTAIFYRWQGCQTQFWKWDVHRPQQTQFGFKWICVYLYIFFIKIILICIKGLDGSMSWVVGLPNNSYKPSTIWRGFASGFVNSKKGCTWLAAANDKIYQLLAHGSLQLLPTLKLVAI